jgi:ATP phosphoribosyltransferase
VDNQLKIALPKGRLQAETAEWLERAGWGLHEYREGSRSYRLKSERFSNLFAKVFHEKDVPIQVAVGNYDLGICGRDWVEELLVKYPSATLIKVRNLGYGANALYMVASRGGLIPGSGALRVKQNTVRIATEYPNLAESFALNQRLRRFSIFPLWGAAEAYPPESAELALVAGSRNARLFNHDLITVSKVLDSNAYLVANKNSWEKKDLSRVLATLENSFLQKEPASNFPDACTIKGIVEQYPSGEVAEGVIWLAIPDGHQQEPTAELLRRAGIRVDDYPASNGNHRPTTSLEGVAIKIIRPQDMPLQVANGNFDLAITGRDWLNEHLYQFPASPVSGLLDLKSGKVRLVAVVTNDLQVDSVYGLKQLYASRSVPIRVASEYVNVADKYARDNLLGMYRVIPTWGATEAFLPEDADLLIENTQTGRTLAQHNLKIIDTLFESTACLIGNKNSVVHPKMAKRIKSIIETLKVAVESA